LIGLAILGKKLFVVLLRLMERRHVDHMIRKMAYKPLHMVSAWASETGLFLLNWPPEKKSNEINRYSKTIEDIRLTGCIVTIDAMGLQKKIVNQIVEQFGGLCHRLSKRNQVTSTDQ